MKSIGKTISAMRNILKSIESAALLSISSSLKSSAVFLCTMKIYTADAITPAATAIDTASGRV